MPDKDLLTVFIPNTPNVTAGFLAFVPRKDAIILDMSVEEAAKMIISAGLVTPEHRAIKSLRSTASRPSRFPRRRSSSALPPQFVIPEGAERACPDPYAPRPHTKLPRCRNILLRGAMGPGLAASRKPDDKLRGSSLSNPPASA